MDYINDLYELCDTLGKTLKESNEKIRNDGGKLSPGDMAYVDQLVHAMKSIKATIGMMEAEEMDDGSSGAYRRGGMPRGSGYSYARGRGGYARRDSMGRYSGRGYSRDGGYSYHGDLMDELRDLMDQTPDEHTRMEMQRLLQKMEQR